MERACVGGPAHYAAPALPAGLNHPAVFAQNGDHASGPACTRIVLLPRHTKTVNGGEVRAVCVIENAS